MTGYAIAAVLWVLGMFPVAIGVEETYKKALTSGIPPVIVVGSGLVFLALWPVWMIIYAAQHSWKAATATWETRK